MVSAGQNASLAAAVLSLLRSATCSLICSSRTDFDNFAYRLVRESQLCRTANILAPIIRRLREMERRKKKKRMVTVDETGSIAVDGFEIERHQWSRLIPKILSRCEELFSSLLVGDDWRIMVDRQIVLCVAADFSFTIPSQDGSGCLPTLQLKLPTDFALLDQLCSVLEVAFHGLGLGSLRYIELERMEVSRCLWHRSTVYYDIFSEKKYSTNTKSGKPVEHKLPHSIARVYLLYRYLVNPIEEFSLALAVPRRRASNHSMRHAVAEIFCFSEVPDAVQVRHFWTSILNYLFPSGDLSGALYAEKDVAESSGHASRTHQVKYSSHLPGGKEYLYRTLHYALGEQPAGGGVNSNLHVRPADLLSALRLFFGPGASYTSIHQQELVEFAASSTTGHGHADLPCGSGKSMAWTLPVAARLLSGRRASGKCTIVVMPYKFLSAFQTDAATQFLERAADVWIVTLNAAAFHGASVPDELLVDPIIPDLLFLTIDALAAFNERHKSCLARLCRNGLIHRFIIDEIHTLLTEDFRSAYQTLRELPSFGIPILTMSGSLPHEFRSTLLRYIGMNNDTVASPGTGEATIIGGGDVLGDFPADFTFCCCVQSSPRQTSFRSACATLEQNPSHGVHIMVTSKSDAMFIASELSKLSIGNRLLTSDVDLEQQESIARDWRKSCFSVLVSTSIAIVGNENPECRHLVLNGYLFNTMNMVQAINRLRPKQRPGGASIKIFLPNHPEVYLDALWQRDRLRFDALAERGLVPNDADLWKKFGSTEGLHQWLIRDDGCWVSNLRQKYGTPQSPCNMCDRCKGTAVRMVAEANSLLVCQRNSTANDAMNVIRRMEHQCIICLCEFCDGEGCLPKGACFGCGGNHFRKNCPIQWKSVLSNKGCFFCLDVFCRQGYESHSSNKGGGCPLQRRLKRLVIHRFSLSSDSDLTQYYSRISSEKSTFYKFLSSAGPPTSGLNTTALSAVHVPDTEISTPLLPPDHYVNNDLQPENMGPADLDNAQQSRSIYQYLANQPKSSRRKRQFVYGAFYKNLIGDRYALIDCQGKGRIEINVEVEGSRHHTTITVLDASSCMGLTKSVVELGQSLGSSGNCRRESGDMGDMWGLGYRNKKDRVLYKKSMEPAVKLAMKEVCTRVITEIGERLPDSLDSIRQGEALGPQCPPLPEMGGAGGPKENTHVPK